MVNFVLKQYESDKVWFGIACMLYDGSGILPWMIVKTLGLCSLMVWNTLRGSRHGSVYLMPWLQLQSSTSAILTLHSNVSKIPVGWTSHSHALALGSDLFLDSEAYFFELYFTMSLINFLLFVLWIFNFSLFKFWVICFIWSNIKSQKKRKILYFDPFG